MTFRNNGNEPRIPAALQHVFLESARGNEKVMPPPPSTFDVPTTSSCFRLLRGFGANSAGAKDST